MIALRPYLAADTALLAEIFRAAIAELTEEDYDDDQRAAWMSGADDEAAFAKRLSGALTLVGTLAGAPVGFVSLAGKDKLDLLYVHPAASRRGVATTLVDATERLAGARGAVALEVEASDTARPFFERRGYVATTRNTRMVEGEWLANTTMRKPLGAGEGGR